MKAQIADKTDGDASPTVSAAKTPLAQEADRRRTFAIISHPDAGKTTLTENLLLSGGAIHLAGQVRARGERRRTRSDWMKIEQARGISVTTSVMTFDHQGAMFNLLDTPGHEDFSEDTYRTLTAVDSAVMVIDAARGIEAQTRKLFEVCRLRDVPIITFINKMDREARDPFELLDEISDTLALDVSPVLWPAGMGVGFAGCYDVLDNRFFAFPDGTATDCSGPDDAALSSLMDEATHAQLAEGAELAREACPAFSEQSYREGHLSPVYFGSALKGFGVPQLISGIARFAPSPRPQPAEPEPVAPAKKQVTGFVFKVQANMDKNHRDRVAFMRVSSGRFQRGMKLRQVGTGKTMAVSNPIFFFAGERELAEEAYPGDIIGVPNHGTLRVGDTLTDGADVRITGIPNFAPEILQRVRLEDPMRAKHLQRALEDLAEEGVTQVFRPIIGSSWIVGVVGQLQLDVLRTRIQGEYQVQMDFEAAPYSTARWIDGDPAKVKAFADSNRGSIANDRDGNPVFMARNDWELRHVSEQNEDLKFSATRERHH